MRLDGKIAIITGAGSGIGRATAIMFAREGAAVVVAEIHEDRAEQVVEEITKNGGRALAIEIDVTDSAAVNGMVARTVEEFGRVDILINNAGASFGQDIRNIDD